MSKLDNLEKKNKSLNSPEVRLLSAQQAAAYLGVSRQTIYELINNNLLGPLRIGKRTLFDRFELDRFVDVLQQKGKK